MEDNLSVTKLLGLMVVIVFFTGCVEKPDKDLDRMCNNLLDEMQQDKASLDDTVKFFRECVNHQPPIFYNPDLPRYRFKRDKHDGR